MIDQIRASKLPSNMMQFAARGALQVPPAENIEILVYLAKHNKVFGDTARMTLAGWDEKASREAAGNPQTAAEVLDYFTSAENLRSSLLAALLENPSVTEAQVLKLATSALRGTVEVILKSKRVRSMPRVVAALRANPYVKKEEADELVRVAAPQPAPVTTEAAPSEEVAVTESEPGEQIEESAPSTAEHDEVVSAYMNDHSHDIASEGEKPFQAIGGVVELLGSDYFPVLETSEASSPGSDGAAVAPAPEAVTPKPAAQAKKPAEGKRENALQKISHLDVKGRIQLALKGNKEERSLLIRDGTKVVALAVLEAPKLSDGEVEKFASQKNVLEAVLRQIPLKRRFMKNYIVVRNLVANPRTPLDLSLGLMKNLLAVDLKNLSANKEVSETIRKLALKMYKQKLEAANKK
ncbi:MAG TPA: hypothetical protein VJQ59_16345 [Candidatus Sulfotelmatobacter sp.]|nr:hypothetical protein [Candidatus Sulfotelmatobacter sp.]